MKPSVGDTVLITFKHRASNVIKCESFTYLSVKSIIDTGFYVRAISLRVNKQPLYEKYKKYNFENL
jgi:hypothetical protein